MADGFLDEADDEDDEQDDVIDAEYEEVDSAQPDSEPLPASPDENSLLKPVDNIDEVVEVYDAFEEIKEKLLTQSDTTSIGDGVHVNKSGWRKIATAFNVSIETVEDKTWEEDGIIHYKVIAKATAPNGKTATGVGMCSSNESNFLRFVAKSKFDRDAAEEKSDNPDNLLKVDGSWRELKEPREVNQHNLFATAATRAKNRAISDLVGGGEVSAEELTADDVL